jgi:hypothetical protein
VPLGSAAAKYVRPGWDHGPYDFLLVKAIKSLFETGFELSGSSQRCWGNSPESSAGRSFMSSWTMTSSGIVAISVEDEHVLIRILSKHHRASYKHWGSQFDAGLRRKKGFTGIH